MSFTIKYLSYPFENNDFQPTNDGKANFFDNNSSLIICAAMILGQSKNEININANFHRMFYGKYCAGFAFEDFRSLPPLCILQTIYDDKANNALYYDSTIYDPRHGVFSAAEYEKKNIGIVSYVQMFIREAYEDTGWKPPVPAEIIGEFEKHPDLGAFFYNMPALEQAKILNYIYFSKPSSFKENRAMSKPLTPAKTKSIISHIQTLFSVSQSGKPAWEELREFETAEAVDILRRCGLTEGMTVLDMGCGRGHYTIPASIAAGARGKVVAVDRDKRMLKEAESRVGISAVPNVTFMNTDENGLSEFENEIDFMMLYDVVNMWGDAKPAILKTLRSLLGKNGILSLAVYGIGREAPYEEELKPYLELLESVGFRLNTVTENGGVHFDDFHDSTKWRKYGEIKVSSLERRNIYNFVKA